jgi:4-hydroxy-tetrahydrodipicolinate synthase
VEPATLARLATIPNIVGVKEASGNIAQMANILGTLPPDFTVLCGDDPITIALMALGGKGVVSVASNQIPAEMTQLAQACLRGDFDTARQIQSRFLPLMTVNFVESNPIPVKEGMAMMGLLEPVYRLPMCRASEQNRARIEKILESAGLLRGVRVAG